MLPCRMDRAAFVHQNLLHLTGNVLGIYFIGILLENKIGSAAFLVIYLLGNVCAYMIYSVFSTYTKGTGASPGIYALIACIIILYPLHGGLRDLHFGTWPVNYTFAYLVLGNFYGMGAFIVHLLGFGTGVIITSLLLLLNALI